MSPSPTERMDDNIELDEKLTVSSMHNDLDLKNSIVNESACRRRACDEIKSSEIDGSSIGEDDRCVDDNTDHIKCSETDCKYSPSANTDERSCVKCQKLNQDKLANMTVYYKKKEDSIVKNSSIRSVLYECFPLWFKSFLKDPEYRMSGIKTKYSSEIHRHADSLLSTSSGFNNYRGLLNLCIILLALANARLFLENIIKYGILIDPVSWVKMFMNQPYSVANIALLLGANVFILIMYCMEKAMCKSMFSEKFALCVQTINLVLLITIPATVILILEPNPLISTVILGLYTSMFLKLVSYASVNKWCRQSRSPAKTRTRRAKSVSMSEGSFMENGKEETLQIQYPENLTLNDLYYFMCAPTLCYELNFPRSLRIRKRFLISRIIEMLFIIQVIGACIQQWILPLVHNSMKPLEEMDGARVVERLLKLAIPNHFIWLMFFYWFFHSTLNVIAELLKFGDREFYKDWWNSDTVNQFWSTWNIPVHRWASRHLYKPLVKRGYSRLNASIAVFFMSAFFHEYLVSVPLHMFKLWAFMGMLGQVPLAILQSKYVHGKLGNMVVWLSLILGQPVAILAYYHDFYVNHVAYQNTVPANMTAP
ncbi:diacylglycerol O-acyltransferase 1-like isoform X1 [Ruditapes philippinarum]|uniref:diacylglycerol O-acyltransferase 1-like isoform X1 n=1 Tax=Ruditapes philippinarum TaxID=129788 RepID=UPI00295A588B|nr:diacylglycerol O-acyltransferase 1-like isoform X1 [Ruditapes philippinarum]